VADIRVGILGTGWSANRHAEALRRLPGVEFVRMAGPEDAAALLADPSLDAVHVCSVNAVHAEQARAALAAGKHVLCEKPLGVSAAQTADLDPGGLVAAVCFNYRHYAVVQHLRSLIAREAYGPAHFVHGGYLQDWLLRETDWNWRLEGGRTRAVADIGSHWADLAQHLLGDVVVEVMADLTTLHPERRREDALVPISTEDFATVMLRFARGARGSFVVSQTSAGHKNHLTVAIDCAGASLAWDQESPERAWIGRRGEPNLELVRDPALGGVLPAGHPEGWNDALLALCSEFYGAVRGDPAPALATFADGHRNLQLLDAIAESGERGTWIGVGAEVGV
jgi:predicted dehydrogenase